MCFFYELWLNITNYFDLQIKKVILINMDQAKPTLGQKISKLIAASPFQNPLNFHKEIEKRFGKSAIKQRRLYFVLNYQGKRKIKDEVIHQIASALKMKFYELIEGTTSEPPAEGPSQGFFPYGPKSNDKLAILLELYHGLPFTPQMIKMKKHGKTIEESEVKPGLRCFRFVLVLRGAAELTIKHKNGNTESIKLKLDDCHCFNSEEPHYFENKSRQFSKILLIKFTKSI